MLVGPPGVYKTTTMKFAGEILEKLRFLNPAPNIVTQAALLKRLVETKDNSIYVFAKEFSDLVMKSEGEMYEFLTSMFDNDAKFEAMTISRDVELVNNPCVNLFAATTPGWISDSMPEAVITGGFASRCIFIYEEEPRFKKLYYKNEVDLNDINAKMMALVEDLKHISTVKGKYSIAPDALEFMEHWNNVVNIIPVGTKMSGYYNRKPKHVHTLAMLLRIAQSDDLTLTLQDFQEALTLLDRLEPNMKKLLTGVGKNKYTGDIRGIRDFIVTRGRVTKKEVLQTFISSAEPLLLERFLKALVDMGAVKLTQEKGELIYVAVVPK